MSSRKLEESAVTSTGCSESGDGSVCGNGARTPVTMLADSQINETADQESRKRNTSAQKYSKELGNDERRRRVRFGHFWGQKKVFERGEES